MRRNWMPLYVPDFIADTMRLSAAETGAYLCLIMDYWMHDGLPDDDAQLAAIARLPLKSWRQMRPTIEAFFHDGWRHKRIDAELVKMIRLAEHRRAAGVKGGSVSAMARWKDANGPSKRQANHQANVKQTPEQNVSKDQANSLHKQNGSNRQRLYTKESITSSSFVWYCAPRAKTQQNQSQQPTISPK